MIRMRARARRAENPPRGPRTDPSPGVILEDARRASEGAGYVKGRLTRSVGPEGPILRNCSIKLKL